MAVAWRDHPSWAIVDAGRSCAGRTTRSSRHRRARRCARPHPRGAARGAAHLARRVGRARTASSTRPVAFAGHSLGQVTALIASGAITLDAGVRFAARRAELTQAAADTHPGRMAALLGATPEQADDACTAAPDGVLGRQRQRTRTGRDRRDARRPGRRLGSRPGARGPAGHRAQRRRGVPHPAHGRCHRRARAGGGDPSSWPPRVRRWCRTTTPSPTTMPTGGATGSPPTSRSPSGGARPWTPSSSSGPPRSRGRKRIDAGGAGQARRTRRHRPQLSLLPKTSPRSWRSPDPWKPC